ncbi:secreted protein [Candidatus Magnetomorum sp. HK-1]|nr:secreted protein [Candidatus Magnetomorum sp. HK-1]
MNNLRIIILILLFLCNACHSKSQFSNESNESISNTSDSNTPDSNTPDSNTTDSNTPDSNTNDIVQKKYEKIVFKGHLLKNKGRFDYTFEQIIESSTKKLIFGIENPDKRLLEFEQDNGIHMTKGSKFFVEEKIDRYAFVDNYISILVRIYEHTGGAQPYRWHKLVNMDAMTQHSVSLVDICGKKQADFVIKQAEKKLMEKYAVNKILPANFFLYKSKTEKPIIDYYHFPKQPSFQPIKISVILEKLGSM